MVRLVILAMMLSLVGCSTKPSSPDDSVSSVQDLPYWQDNYLSSLSDGEHHPAIANLLEQAERARQQQQWSRVQTYLDQARQIQPRNPGIFYRQAWVALQRNEFGQAEQLLQRALVFARGDVGLEERIYLLMAESLASQGRTMEADSIRYQASQLRLQP